MIKKKRDNTYEITGNFQTKQDKDGMTELTVDGTIQLLKQLSSVGYGGKILLISYDTGYASTSLTRGFHFNEDETILYLEAF